MLDWTQIVIVIIGLVFTAVIIPLVKAGFEWLKSKTKNETLLAALTEAGTVADQVVASLQANLVDGLKTAAPDGKLTPEQIKDVSAKAFEMFKSDLSTGSMKVLEDNADDITVYVKNLLESHLAILKK